MLQEHTTRSTLTQILSWGLVVFGSLMIVLIWVMVAIVTRSSAPYMALVVVLDVWLMMHFTGINPARHWVWLVMIVLISLLLAWHALTASKLGLLFGIMPLQAVTMSSIGLTHEHMASTFGAWDWLCLVLALLLAGWLCRPKAHTSHRRS